jgi:hypothetical protein
MCRELPAIIPQPLAPRFRREFSAAPRPAKKIRAAQFVWHTLCNTYATVEEWATRPSRRTRVRNFHGGLRVIVRQMSPAQKSNWNQFRRLIVTSIVNRTWHKPGNWF